MLVWQREPTPFYLLVIPFLWSIVGSTAALYFGIIEDAGLLISALSTVAILALRKK